MRLFRMLLLAANFAAGLTLLLAARYSGGTDDFLWALAAGALCTLNFIYIVSNEALPGRFGRMFSLWLSAKERDLERRATAAGSPHSGASDASRDRS